MNKRSMRKVNMRKRRITRRSMRKISMINPFLFMKINGYLYHQRVFPPLKNALTVYVIREQCCPSSLVSQPSADIVMAVWHPFCLNLNFLGRV